MPNREPWILRVFIRLAARWSKLFEAPVDPWWEPKPRPMPRDIVYDAKCRPTFRGIPIVLDKNVAPGKVRLVTKPSDPWADVRISRRLKARVTA